MTEVMIVDDDESFLDLASTFLEKGGYETITAPSGKEAVNYLEKGKDPDLVLLDMMMPGMDGWETYDRLKDVKPNIDVAFLSALENVPDLKSTGVLDYIVKRRPFTQDRFVRKVRKLIGPPE